MNQQFTMSCKCEELTSVEVNINEVDIDEVLCGNSADG